MKTIHIIFLCMWVVEPRHDIAIPALALFKAIHPAFIPIAQPSPSRCRDKSGIALSSGRGRAASDARAARGPRRSRSVAATAGSSARSRCASSRRARTARAARFAQTRGNSQSALWRAYVSRGFPRRCVQWEHSRKQRTTPRLHVARVACLRPYADALQFLPRALRRDTIPIATARLNSTNCI